MALAHFIYHAPVGAPTYLDLLPVDVLRYALIPFLGWEDRIHLNMLTPPGDRTPPKKIPKDRIIAHHNEATQQLLYTSRKACHKIFERWCRTQTPADLKAYNDAHHRWMKLHADSVLLHKHSPEFRSDVRVVFANWYPTSRDPDTRARDIADFQALRDAHAKPTEHKIRSERWLRGLVTQNNVLVTRAVYAVLVGRVGVTLKEANLYREGKIFTVREDN